MVVSVHQALGDHLPSPHLMVLLHKIEEHLTISMIGEYRLRRQAPIHDVIIGQREFYAQETRRGRKKTTSGWTPESRADLTPSFCGIDGGNHRAFTSSASRSSSVCPLSTLKAARYCVPVKSE